MRRFTRAISVLMTAALTITMAGCSSPGGTDSGITTGTGESSAVSGTDKSGDEKSKEDQKTSADGKKTVIDLWHTWSGSEADALLAVVNDFNGSQSEIQVEVLSSQTEDKMLTAIPSGEGPDVVYTADTTCSKWAQAGLLTPIDEYITSSGIDTANIYESVYELGNYGGVQYGMPYTMDSYMLFYNKKVLEEAGVKPPATLEEMAEISKKVAQKEGNDYTRLGYVPDYPWIDRVEMPYLFGAEFYDFEADKVTCDSDEFKNALNYKAQYYTDYGISEVTKFKSGFGAYASNDNPFFKGKIVFAIEGEWFENFIDLYAPEDFEWGAVEVPVTESKPELKGSGRLQGGMLSITSTSKKLEAAYQVIQYLTSDDAYIKFCAAKGSLPTTYTALKSDKLVSQAPQLSGFVTNVLAGKAKAFPAVPFSAQYSDQQGLAEEAIYSGEKTVDEAITGLYEGLAPLADEWKNSR